MGGIGDGAHHGGGARHGHTVGLAQQALDNHRGDVATAVGAVVDDEGLFIELRIEVARKLVQSFRTHVGDVDVADSSARQLVHRGDVALNPFVVNKWIFIADGFHHHFSAAFGRCGVDGEFGEHVGAAIEQRIDVGGGGSRHAINGCDVVALFYVQTLVEQRRAQ